MKTSCAYSTHASPKDHTSTHSSSSSDTTYALITSDDTSPLLYSISWCTAPDDLACSFIAAAVPTPHVDAVVVYVAYTTDASDRKSNLQDHRRACRSAKNVSSSPASSTTAVDESCSCGSASSGSVLTRGAEVRTEIADWQRRFETEDPACRADRGDRVQQVVPSKLGQACEYRKKVEHICMHKWVLEWQAQQGASPSPLASGGMYLQGEQFCGPDPLTCSSVGVAGPE